MSIVQRQYPEFHGEKLDGQIANTQTCDIDSRRLAGTDSVPFGRAVMPSNLAGAGDQDILLGARRRQVATVNGSINNSATTLVIDAPSALLSGGGDALVGSFILVGSEILQVTAANAAATDLTVVRAARGSTAAAVGDDAAVFAFDSVIMAGVAVSDPRLPAKSEAVYTPAEVVSTLWRGDVAVKVSAAVAKHDPVVVATAASGAGNAEETVGQFSAKAPSATHIRVPNAEFIYGAPAQGIAVMRLSGPQT